MRLKLLPLCGLLVLMLCMNGCMGIPEEPTEQVNYSEETISAIQTLTGGDIKDFYKLFDENMKKEMSQQELLRLWNEIIQKYGAFEYYLSDVSIHPKDGYQIASVPCVFKNGTVTFRLTFNKNAEISGFYVSEDTDSAGLPHLSNDTDITFGTEEYPLTGCLTLPEGDGPFPAVVLVQGYGPSDRNEQTGPNVPFLDIAQQLSKEGIAVLRYDKRTYLYGQEMTADESYTVFDETVDDAALAVEFLKTRNTIDPTQIYVAGHGFGGYLIPRIASKTPDAEGYIMLAPYARPLEDVLVSQSKYVLHIDPDISKEESDNITRQLLKTVDLIKNLTPESDIPAKKLNKLPKSYWLDLKEYDPLKEAQSVSQPILLLQGGRDYQTTSADYEAWKNAMQGKEHFHVHFYEKLNHLFMSGSEPSSPADYEIKSVVSTDMTSDIISFVKSHAGTEKDPS